MFNILIQSVLPVNQFCCNIHKTLKLWLIMIPNDMWKQIQTLSDLDKKDVTGCALKVAEECGELSGKVQSYSSLDGSHHKLATNLDILEECVDGILANLSIACKLEFDSDSIIEMLTLKINKWANIQKSQAIMNQKIPFEIHVTVDEADSEAFKNACTLLGVKPIILALQLKQDTLRDVMTSSVCMGSNSDALSEMNRIEKGLLDAGFNVVRKKIETVPWHPAAPSVEFNKIDMPKGCYFESHIAVLIDSDETRLKVDHYCSSERLHISRNAMKEYDDNSYKLMITYRDYNGTKEAFLKQLETYVKQLKLIEDRNGEQIKIDKVITEFSLFDSRIHHDASWLSANT